MSRVIRVVKRAPPIQLQRTLHSSSHGHLMSFMDVTIQDVDQLLVNQLLVYGARISVITQAVGMGRVTD